MIASAPAEAQAAFREFWDFCAERQRVLIRKERGFPRPWTQDPVLDKYFFCNINRRADTGTAYVIQMEAEVEGLGDYLFNVLAYRAFNLIGTSHAVRAAHRRNGNYRDPAGPWLRLGYFDPEAAFSALAARRDAGEKVFTGAFLTTGLINAAKARTEEEDSVAAVCWYLRDLQALVPMRAAEMVDLEDAYTQLLTLPGFGRFLAYQCALDVNYRLGGSEDDFTVLGPGAEAGLNIVYPGVGGAPGRLLAACRDLRARQPKCMPTQSLTLCDVEHALCEFAKYHRIKHGTGAATRRYTPGGAR